MQFDVVTLSRIQFALTIMFHYLFPPLTIGLGGLLVSLEWQYLRTGDRQYEEAAKFWTKIFAINFAVGVATGIVMEFQFGTNWATYSRYVGDVFGSALAAEGIFAFFLESGFLAVLVFGWDRVSKRMHFFSTCMVALGAIFSSIWIVVANSWQQTPAGFHIVGAGASARAEITDFWPMVFNPSSVHRLLHVWIGAYILGAFFVMSISAYYLLRERHVEFAKKSFHSALTLATVMSLAALVQGDLQAKKVAVTQPAKLAAMEARFETGTGPSPLYVFGLPGENERRVEHGLAIPGLLSFLVHGNFREPVNGLDKIPRADWPPVAVTFHSFHSHGVAGNLFHRHHALRNLPALARNVVRQALVDVGVCIRRAAAVHRQSARLGDGGGRAAAVGRVRHAAHERRGVESGCRESGPRFDHRLPPDLRHAVCGLGVCLG